jgi:hypothetical protein
MKKNKMLAAHLHTFPKRLSAFIMQKLGMGGFFEKCTKSADEAKSHAWVGNPSKRSFA